MKYGQIPRLNQKKQAGDIGCVKKLNTYTNLLSCVRNYQWIDIKLNELSLTFVTSWANMLSGRV